MKKALALFLALVMCLSLCACGNGEKKPVAAEAPQENVETVPPLTIPDTSSATVLKEGECGINSTFKLYDNGVLLINGTEDVSGILFSMYADYIEYVKIEEGITYIGNKVFSNLEKNRIVELPSTIKYIDVAAFRDNTRLESVNFPEGLEIIESHAFTMCISLESVMLPSTLTMLGEEAFGYCGIKDLVIKNGLPSIGDSAFCSNEMESVVIPGSVEIVGSKAFASCENLTTVILCDGVKRLYARAFENIKIIAIPDSLEVVSPSGMGEPNQVSSAATVYCNEGSFAANYYYDRCDVIVGYDGFIKDYDLTQYQ